MEQEHAIKARIGQALEHIEGVAHVKPNIPQVPAVDMAERSDDAVEERFAADEPAPGGRLGLTCKVFAGAETDLQHAWRAATECLVHVERLFAELHAIPWPQLIERTLLSGCCAAAANDKATYGAAGRRVRRSVRGLIVCHFGMARACKWSYNNLAAECSGAPLRIQRDN